MFKLAITYILIDKYVLDKCYSW